MRIGPRLMASVRQRHSVLARLAVPMHGATFSRHVRIRLF